MIPLFDHHLHLEAGEVIGDRYEAVRRIARGGMGEVWAVRHTSLDVSFAMKLLAPVSGIGDDTVSRFELEARVGARLGRQSHYIVPVIDYGLHHARPYLVMPLIEGPSLEERLAPGALDLPSSTRVIRHVARALTVAHREGVVHRDLKPGNVLLVFDDDRFFAKVTDFGIAKPANPAIARHHVTEHGALLGTPMNMSPEQANGEEVDGRCDVWALACVAYRCVVGRDAFSGRTALEILRHVCGSDFVVPSAVNEELPSALDSVFVRAFGHDLDRRYESRRDFADAFGAACGA
jgi:serine/threonine-protein kinase